MEGLLQIRPSKPEQANELIALAEDNGTQAIGVTHTLTRNDKLVGFFAIGSVPMLLAFVSPTLVQGRETVHMLNSLENIMAGLGIKNVVIPLPEESPLHQYMESVGFKKASNKCDLFCKEL